jgi:hypothetical protein
LAVCPASVEAEGFAAGDEAAADGVVSAQDVPENVLVDGSSAWARCGVSPMPMSTAVGIAAMAITLPAGTWILVSSDFLGAA